MRVVTSWARLLSCPASCNWQHQVSNSHSPATLRPLTRPLRSSETPSPPSSSSLLLENGLYEWWPVGPGSVLTLVLKLIFPLQLVFTFPLPLPTIGISLSSDPFLPLPSRASRSCLKMKNFGKRFASSHLDRPKSFETGPGLGPSSSSSLESEVKGLVELIVSGVNGFDELIVVEELIRSSGSHRWFQGEASYINQEPEGAHIINQIPCWLICSSSHKDFVVVMHSGLSGTGVSLDQLELLRDICSLTNFHNLIIH